MNKPQIVCIHGFGKRNIREYDFFVEWFKDRFDITIPLLFDLNDETDTDYHKWIERAEKALEGKDEVYLVGFSMGGVVASYLASKYRNVKKLFLLEPAFEYLTISAATNKIKTSITKATPNMPEAFEKGFRELVAEYKGAVKNVTVPVMFIHCSEDEVIPVSSSRNAYEKTPSDKKLFAVLEGGCHRVMDDPKLNTFVFKAIDSEIGYQLSWKEETRKLVKEQWNRLFKK